MRQCTSFFFFLPVSYEGFPIVASFQATLYITKSSFGNASNGIYLHNLPVFCHIELK